MGPGISSVAVLYLDLSVFQTGFERCSYTISAVEPSNQAVNQQFQNNLNSVNIIGNSTSKKGTFAWREPNKNRKFDGV